MALDTADRTVTFAELLIPILRHRYVVVGWALVGAIVGIVLALAAQHTYTTVVSFFPESRQSTQGIAAIASQFGVQVAQGELRESPEYYATLLDSRALLSGLAAQTFDVRRSSVVEPRPIALVELLEIDSGLDERVRRAVAVEWLRDAIGTSIGRTGMVTVTVTTRWPDLSYALGEHVVNMVNDYNVRTRQSRAAAERRFIEGRVVEAERGVLAAERQLEQFLERNRQYANAPQLVFEYERMQRRLGMEQARLATLTQALEEARIAEIRDTPVITIVEPPELALVPDAQAGVVMRGLLGGVAGLILGMLFVSVGEIIRRSAGSETKPMKDLAAAWHDVVQEFRFMRRSPTSSSDRSA